MLHLVLDKHANNQIEEVNSIFRGYMDILNDKRQRPSSTSPSATYLQGLKRSKRSFDLSSLDSGTRTASSSIASTIDLEQQQQDEQDISSSASSVATTITYPIPSSSRMPIGTAEMIGSRSNNYSCYSIAELACSSSSSSDNDDDEATATDVTEEMQTLSLSFPMSNGSTSSSSRTSLKSMQNYGDNEVVLTRSTSFILSPTPLNSIHYARNPFLLQQQPISNFSIDDTITTEYKLRSRSNSSSSSSSTSASSNDD